MFSFTLCVFYHNKKLRKNCISNQLGDFMHVTQPLWASVVSSLKGQMTFIKSLPALKILDSMMWGYLRESSKESHKGD